MTDDDRYHIWMRSAVKYSLAGLHDVAFDDLRYAWKIARYTRTGTPRTSDAWERRAQWASACWIAAQRLSGGTRDTQED